MAVNLNQNATLANLKQTVENMKVYIDSDKTVSIKGYLNENNTHKFYNTSTPTTDTTPIFSFDVATEYFLDQTKTTFVQEFEWSDTVYTGSTNPNLEGKPVFVLAVKGENSVSYSFINLETLIDTYKTKDTATLSLDITDNEISGEVNISAEEGNAVVAKSDGIYVPTTAETKVSEAEGNIIETKEDGIYVAPTDLTNYVEKVDGKGLSTNDLTDEMVEKIGNTYEKDETYSRTEIDDAITNAQLGGEEVDLTGYVKTETLTEELAKYSTTEVSDEKYVLDEEIEVLDVAAIEQLLNLSDEELQGLSQIIDDSSVRIDKTNSSSFIYQSIQDAIATGKEFTLSEIAKASTASYKVVSDTTSVTDSKYIYLIANSSNSYDMYILDETDGAVRIGETTIDLSGYVTTETANQTYVLQTDFTLLEGNIGNVSDLTTDEKQIVSAINEIDATVDKILDGTTVVPKATDAETLGGLSANDFAKVDDIANVEISTDENNQLEQKDDGLYVGKVYKEVTQEEYNEIENKDSDNILYFITDAEPTQNGNVNKDAETLGGYSADYFATVQDISKIDGTEMLTTSILEKALTLNKGVYVYRLQGSLYTGNDMPTSKYNYGTCVVTVGDVIKVINMGMLGSNGLTYPPIFNDYNLTTQIWSGWQTFATTEDLTRYLPLSGGTITGNRIDLLNGYGHVISGDGFLQFGSKNEVDSSDNMRALIVHNSNAKTLNSSVQLIDKVDGEVATYDVVHSGNVEKYVGANVDKTTLTVNDWCNANITYRVVNGICYVTMYITSDTMSMQNQIVPTTLPKSALGGSNWFSLAASADSTQAPIQNLLVKVSDTGEVSTYSGTNSVGYFGTFSYPVVEN